MRDLTGANTIRFLIAWEGVQPAPDRIDTGYLDRAVDLFETLPDSADKADAYAELGRLHMLNYERDPAGARRHGWVGDPVGDPRKDTTGPSRNILIKRMAIISLVCAPCFEQSLRLLG